ncbi:hypothetical protein ACFE04_010974 [Oxalis oulophora]
MEHSTKAEVDGEPRRKREGDGKPRRKREDDGRPRWNREDDGNRGGIEMTTGDRGGIEMTTPRREREDDGNNGNDGTTERRDRLNGEKRETNGEQPRSTGKKETDGVIVVVTTGPIAEAATCDVTQLAPCAAAFTGSGGPSSACCSKLNEQKPCLCGYIKNPTLGQYVNSPKARSVAATCHVAYPHC